MLFGLNQLKAGKNNKRKSHRNRKEERPKQAARKAKPKQTESVVLSSEEVSALEVDLKTFCEDLCEFMVGRKVKVETSVDDYRLCLNIDDDEIAAMMNKNYKVAESLEHLLRKKPRHLKRELSF